MADSPRAAQTDDVDVPVLDEPAGRSPHELDEAQLSRAAISAAIAGPLKLSVEEAAHGIRQIANVNMARAIRAVTVERGKDPRDLALMAFQAGFKEGERVFLGQGGEAETIPGGRGRRRGRRRSAARRPPKARTPRTAGRARCRSHRACAR